MLTPLAANPQPLLEFFQEAGYIHEQFKRNQTLRDLPSQRSRRSAARPSSSGQAWRYQYV